MTLCLKGHGSRSRSRGSSRECGVHEALTSPHLRFPIADLRSDATNRVNRKSYIVNLRASAPLWQVRVNQAKIIKSNQNQADSNRKIEALRQFNPHAMTLADTLCRLPEYLTRHAIGNAAPPQIQAFGTLIATNASLCQPMVLFPRKKHIKPRPAKNLNLLGKSAKNAQKNTSKNTQFFDQKIMQKPSHNHPCIHQSTHPSPYLTHHAPRHHLFPSRQSPHFHRLSFDILCSSALIPLS